MICEYLAVMIINLLVELGLIFWRARTSRNSSHKVEKIYKNELQYFNIGLKECMRKK